MVSKVPKLHKPRLKRAVHTQSATEEVAEELTREYRYASHHHLIPLYIFTGASIVALLIMSCFVAVLWQNDQRRSYAPAANTAVQVIENKYLPAIIQPTEKKQYIYSANVRFPISDPYTTIRYMYEPGIGGAITSPELTISTTPTLQNLEAPLLESPEQSGRMEARMQQCARLYIVRFLPGLTQYGYFAPLKEVKLKDGRTAYIHKNTECVPDSVQAMNQLQSVENDLEAIESF